MHSIRPVLPVETQGDFFCHLTGQTASTRLAIVHWIRCIDIINTNSCKICLKFITLKNLTSEEKIVTSEEPLLFHLKMAYMLPVIIIYYFLGAI